MSLIARITEQIRRTEERKDFDPAALREQFRASGPHTRGTAKETEDRRRFLQETVEAGDSNLLFERILNGNELQSVNYLSRGARAAKAVCRIAMNDPVDGVRGWGTGFLIAPEVVITNNHVLAREEAAAASQAHFSYEVDESDLETGPEVFSLDPNALFYTNKELDFTVVAVRGLAGQPDRFGYLPLLTTLGKALEGEWLTIIQHPKGERKQLAARENRFLKKGPETIWYSTDTVGGSSGSPVTNNDWFVVALHHSGVPVRKNGRIQAIDGQDWDGTDETCIKWEANEGIRASVIANDLMAKRPNHPLLLPMFRATPQSGRVTAETPPDSTISRTPSIPQIQLLNKITMSTKTISVPLEIEADVRPDGTLTLLRASLGTGGAAGARESALAIERDETAPESFEEASFDSPFDENYKGRRGYDPKFLGGAHEVDLPGLGAMVNKAAPLLNPPQNGNKHELKYHNFSVVMHAERRFAVFSAANVNMGNRFQMSRPTDVWRIDPRIDAKYQISNFYYRKNQFDRGHLTRREDLEFGLTPRDALLSAADTCHWSNCSPQHKRFNQNKQTWQGLERHILEDSIINGHLNAQVITGPILEEDDPIYQPFPDVRYPVRYWKVVAGLKSDGTLFSVAFILDQGDVIRQFGLAEAAVPIGAFRTFQTKVSEIERVTGLIFGCKSGGVKFLRDCDPMKDGLPPVLRRTRRRVRPEESFELSDLGSPESYNLITSPGSIYLGK